MNIADLRTTYRRATLNESDVAADPFAQFRDWLDQAIAAQALEPTAMTLATVDAGGKPSARVVLLKGLDVDAPVPAASGRGFVWFTNYDSHKGRDLAVHADAALCFFWPELERQVRVEGRVAKASADESDRYFASRPLGSRVGAWRRRKVPRCHRAKTSKPGNARSARASISPPMRRTGCSRVRRTGAAIGSSRR